MRWGVCGVGDGVLIVYLWDGCGFFAPWGRFFLFTREEGRVLSCGLVHDVKTFSSWAVAATCVGDDVVVSLRGWFVMAVLSLSVGAVRDQHIPGPDLHMGEKGWIGMVFTSSYGFWWIQFFFFIF
jgi:hypothetical protein